MLLRTPRRFLAANVRHNLKMTQHMMNFIIILLEVIVGGLSAYLIYYARQKGKNQAEKEDLKDLTEIVETIKKKNTDDTEFLRASLQIINDREKLIFNEEKESIILFFSQLNTWIWDSLNIYVNEYNHTNFNDISQRLITMRDSYNKTNVTFSKVRLIVDDNELINTGNDAIIKTLALHHFKESILKRLSTNLTLERVMVDQLVNKEINVRNMDPTLLDFYTKQAQDREKEKKEIIDEYFKNHSEKFKTAIDTINSFKELAKFYLRK